MRFPWGSSPLCHSHSELQQKIAMGNNCCQPEDADQVNQRKPPNRRAEPASKGGFVELEEVDHATMGNSQSHKSSDQNSNRALVNDLVNEIHLISSSHAHPQEKCCSHTVLATVSVATNHCSSRHSVSSIKTSTVSAFWFSWKLEQPSHRVMTGSL